MPKFFFFSLSLSVMDTGDTLCCFCCHYSNSWLLIYPSVRERYEGSTLNLCCLKLWQVGTETPGSNWIFRWPPCLPQSSWKASSLTLLKNAIASETWWSKREEWNTTFLLESVFARRVHSGCLQLVDIKPALGMHFLISFPHKMQVWLRLSIWSFLNFPFLWVSDSSWSSIWEPWLSCPLGWFSCPLGWFFYH